MNNAVNKVLCAKGSSHRVCVAPMMDYTDRHFRFFIRLMTRYTRLYTEMLTASALIYGDPTRHLKFHESEHPLALQVGGSNPEELAQCARLATDYGYDEINLNVGCPSNRVQSGRFGACLMTEPKLVADCVAAMSAVSGIPVTVKTRIGVDDHDSFEELVRFIDLVSKSGCYVFVIHARKAWLQGLSPKQNRELPPLRYEVVRRIKQAFPHLCVVINGGIKSLQAVEENLVGVSGVMIGREAITNPYLFSSIDHSFFDASAPILTRKQVLDAWLPYVSRELASGVPLASVVRHTLGFFRACAGARLWRRYLSEHAHRRDAGIEVLIDAHQKLSAVL